MNTIEINEQTTVGAGVSLDHRLTALKQELDKIYAKQDELLHQINPQLGEDFRMTRADRLRELSMAETENHWLLSTWVNKY